MVKRFSPGLLPRLVQGVAERTRGLPVTAWLAFAAAAALAGGGLFAAACGRSGAVGNTEAGAPRRGASTASVSAAASAAATGDERLDVLWAAAAAAPEGEADELLRLAHYAGSPGLVEAAQAGRSAVVAARALAFTDDFVGAPFLADLARTGAPEEAAAALDALLELAAQPRRAVDPEDAAELRRAALGLRDLAHDAKAPRAHRVAAVRALRMLADRGCVRDGEIPSDVDAVVPPAAATAR